MALRPFGVQDLDELLEGKLLVGLRLERRQLDRRQQLGERGIRGEVGPEHERIAEQAQQRRGLLVMAPRDRHADEQVVGRRVTM